MNPLYQGIWLLLYDWQTLIAGLLAVVAATAASFAAYRVGKSQVSAVEKQNDEMKERERRALARETKISAGLFTALTKAIQKNIEDTQNIFSQDWHPGPFNENWKPQKNLISPPLYPVFNHLGKLDIKSIEMYFSLCTRIDQFRALTAPVRDDLLCELREISRLVSDILENIENDHG
jgi:hypothetical protein